jgi:glycosyltransferase involved in cell wall biosynthesis
MRLTTIVPATDGPPTLDRALAAIRRAQAPPEELIVVDEPRRLGPAAARNRAAGEATGDVLVFVDADVEIPP